MSPPTQIFVSGSGHVHYAPIDDGAEYIRADLHGQEIARLRSALEEIYALSESCSIERLREALSSHLSLSALADPSEDDKEAAQLQSLLVSKFPTFRPSYPSGLFAWATAALSVPAETNSVQTGSKSVIPGEWCEFQGNGLPLRAGDKIATDSVHYPWANVHVAFIGQPSDPRFCYRRFHPATTNQDQSE